MADESASSTFRNKVNFMKSWKPESSPSNRDRLELYSLHKQAISGDAPSNFVPSSFGGSNEAAEKARYQAWKNKRGLSAQEAMAAYSAECDRQIRVYGGAGFTENPQAPSGNNNDDDAQAAPRGLAAIPLLCAAASESRIAYLRRLSRTTSSPSWWSRQEPLCATPGSVTSLAEAMLLAIASLVEYISLSSGNMIPLIPPTVVQSFLWPLHNASLAIWMLLILLIQSTGAAVSLASTLLWGSRRTGQSLPKLWKDSVVASSDAIHALCQEAQPISVRLVGLILLPYTLLVEGLCLGLVEKLFSGNVVLNAVVYVLSMVLTWWFWLLVAPLCGSGIMVSAFWSGFCFALIEFAGV